jgi:cysteine-rich repeat protein
VHEGEEECDDGNLDDTDACLSDCALPACGDGIVQNEEECDDGNASDADECVACELARCGDGAVHAEREPCDDGNTLDSDACLTGCIAARCGDQVVHEGEEECDDGNQDDSDACAACVLARCGDGTIWTGQEECDDGNGVDSDECTSRCENAVCGDGVLWQGREQCDDGNADDTDECLSNCERARCGDAVIHAGVEQCDDGNDSDNDDCIECADARCGDGHVWEDREECDEADNNDRNACTGDCRVAECGDGLIWDGEEQCDDGNDVEGDGCEPECRDTPGKPRVVLLIDRSGTMSRGHWDAVGNALSAEAGLLEAFDNQLRLGFLAFRGVEGLCPELSAALAPLSGTSQVIAESYPASATSGDDTPLSEAIEAAVELVGGVGNRHIVLVTNADPDSCEVINPQCGYDQAIAAVQDAADDEVTTHVVGLEGGGLSPWFGQALANAGVGMGVRREQAIDDCENQEGNSIADYDQDANETALYYSLPDEDLERELSVAFEQILSEIASIYN